MTKSSSEKWCRSSAPLLANGFDVKWVMSQVGHADSKMTMDVYAQLEQRVDRSHGTAFDELVRRARGQQNDAEWDASAAPVTLVFPTSSGSRCDRDKPVARDPAGRRIHRRAARTGVHAARLRPRDAPQRD